MEPDKFVNKEYGAVIDICKMLKTHGTTAALLYNGLVVMEPIIDNIRNYAVLQDVNSYQRFRQLYINLGEVSPIHTKFKKTLSTIRWKDINGIPAIEIQNKDQEPYTIFTLQYEDDFLNRVYERVPGWSEYRQRVLTDEPDEIYTPCEGLAERLAEKKICQVIANGNQLLFSRPFLGETKNTKYIGFRVVEETDTKIVVKFKQTEKLGNIYTYASFLKIPYTGEIES